MSVSMRYEHREAEERVFGAFLLHPQLVLPWVIETGLPQYMRVKKYKLPLEYFVANAESIKGVQTNETRIALNRIKGVTYTKDSWQKTIDDARPIWSHLVPQYAAFIIIRAQTVAEYPRQQVPRLEYAEYLQSKWWQEIRDYMLRLSENRCSLCSTKNGGLHVHHRTYERVGCELPEDLTVLCSSCHEVYHEHEKPKKMELRQLDEIEIYTTAILEVIKRGPSVYATNRS